MHTIHEDTKKIKKNPEKSIVNKKKLFKYIMS